MQKLVKNSVGAIAVEYVFIMPLLLYLGFLLMDLSIMTLNNLTANRLAEKLGLEVHRIVAGGLEEADIQANPTSVFVKKIIQDKNLCSNVANEASRRLLFIRPVSINLLNNNPTLSQLVVNSSNQSCGSSVSSATVNTLILFPESDARSMNNTIYTGALNNNQLNNIRGNSSLNINGIIQSNDVIQNAKSNNGAPIDGEILKGTPMPFSLMFTYTTPFSTFTKPVICRLTHCDSKNNIIIFIKKTAN